MQDTRRQAVIALRWLPLILLGALAAGAFAYAYADSQPKVYEATASLIVDPGPNPDVQDMDVAGGAVVRYIDQAVTPSVAKAVIEELGLADDPEELLERVEASTPEEDGLELELELSARGGDPEAARLLARAIGDELVRRVRDELITSEVKAANAAIATNQRSISTLQTRFDQLRRKNNKTALEFSEMSLLAGQISSLQRAIQESRPSSTAFVRNRLEWLEGPTTPEEPVEPRPLYWALLALVAGGMLAAGLAFVLEYLRHYNRVRDEQDLEDATGLPALGSIAEKRGDAKRGGVDRLVMLRYPRGEAAEAYRGLVTRIGFASGPARTLMVASAIATDGKSAVAANLALAYAEAGRNVVLVDADYRAPRQHAFFNVLNDRGVTNVVVDHDVPLSWVLVPTAHPKLRLMPGGPPPPRLSGTLGERQVDALLTGLLKVADMVVVDSPSISDNLDAAVLATHLQGAVLVVPADARTDDAAEAARKLLGSKIDVVGAILYRQVRGSHKRADAVPIAAAPSGAVPSGPTAWPAAPPSPPRRIPAVVTATQPDTGRPAGPAPAGAGQYRPPASAGANSSSGATTPPASGPYNTPFRPSGSSSD